MCPSWHRPCPRVPDSNVKEQTGAKLTQHVSLQKDSNVHPSSQRNGSPDHSNERTKVKHPGHRLTRGRPTGISVLPHAANPGHTCHVSTPSPNLSRRPRSRATLARTLGTSALLLAVAAVAAASCSSAAAASVEVAEVCKGTPYAELCSATAGKQASHYQTVDALAVLSMQVDAFSKRAAAARLHAVKISASANVTRGALKALQKCDEYYSNVEDNLGATRRAIGLKDAVTIRAMMSMSAQDMKNCDEEFTKNAAENPMTRFDQSLLNISENCRALSNMI